MNNREGERKRTDEMRMRVLFATPLHATLVGLAGGGGTGKSHTFRRRKMEAGSEREGRPVCEEAISPSSVGDSNPLLVWDLGVSDCLTTVSACLLACSADRSIDRRRVGDAFAGCVMFAVYLEQCSPAAINQIQSLGEKRGERERGRADGRRRMTVDVEEIVMPSPPPMKKKTERASERQRERGDLSASVHVVT